MQSGSISQVLTLAGQFQSYQVVKIHPKVSGYIQHIYVDIGDIVHRGETLAVLQVPGLQAQLQDTVFSISQTKDDVVRAENEVQRTESRHAALHDEYERLVRASKAQSRFLFPGIPPLFLPAPAIEKLPSLVVISLSVISGNPMIQTRRRFAGLFLTVSRCQ